MDNDKIADSLMELAPVAGKAYKQLLQDNKMAVEAIAKLEIELEEANKRADAAEYEKGRLERKLKEEIEVVEEYEHLFRAADAVLGAVIRTVGEISLPKEAVDEAVRTNSKMVGKYDEENRTYILRTVQDGE